MKFFVKIYALLLTITLFGCVNVVDDDDRKVDPVKVSEIYVQKSIEYIKTGNYAVALKDLKVAIDQNEDNIHAHNTIAMLYGRLGNSKKAQKHFNEAIDLDEKNSDVRHNYGTFLCSNGDYKKAEEQFLKAVSNPFYKQAKRSYVNAGICAEKSSDINKAGIYYLKSLRIDSRFSPALAAMSELSLRQKKYKKAKFYLDRYRKKSALNAKTAWTGYQIEDALGNRNLKSSYEILLKAKFPDSSETLKLLDYNNKK